MSADLRDLLPRHKSDLERARAITTLGYPAVAPVLPELLEWLQDGNWPVARALVRLLTSVGEPLLPLVREVFSSADGAWKYWCIELFVRALPRPVAGHLRPELQRLAHHPTAADRVEEVDERAREALAWLNGE
jgi:hypothetical protein